MSTPRVYYCYSASGLGKSTFALSGPKKKWYAELDAGSFERAESGLDIPKDLIDINYFYPPIKWDDDEDGDKVVDTSMVGKSGHGAIKVITKLEGFRELRKQFRNAYGKALQDPEIEDVIIDTESNYYDLIQLAQKQRFQEELGVEAGKLKRAEYDELYAEMFQIMRGAKGSRKNLILLAHEKELWIGGEPTGKFIPDGCKKVPDEADVSLRFVKKNRKPVAIIVKAGGADMRMVDMEIEEPTIEKVDHLLDCAKALQKEMKRNKGLKFPEDVEGIINLGSAFLDE